MASQSQPSRAWNYAQVSIISCGLLVTGASQAMEGRLPLSVACRAWNSHIAELIDQHRTAHELDDDQLSEIIPAPPPGPERLLGPALRRGSGSFVHTGHSHRIGREPPTSRT